MSLFNGSAEMTLLKAIYAQNNAILSLLVTQGATQMASLTQLTTDVANETTVMQSAETLISGLAAQITAAGTDPEALKALTTQMETNASQLAASVAANTPAAPAPAPTPTTAATPINTTAATPIKS